MSEVENKYVIQIQHQPTGETNGTYIIKDKDARQKLDAWTSDHQLYRGMAGANKDGVVSDDWIDNSNTSQGFYTVVSLDNSIDIDDTIGVLIEDSADKSTKKWWVNNTGWSENYVTFTDSTSNITKIALPGVLTIRKNTENNVTTIDATIIDAAGMIWKRELTTTTTTVTNENQQSTQTTTTGYLWTNLWDNKIDIRDFRNICNKFENYKTLVDQLQSKLASFEEEVNDLKELKLLSQILIDDPDEDAEFKDVLVLGNYVMYKDNGATYPVQDLVRKYLKVNGTVVWTRNCFLGDCLRYCSPDPTTGRFPIFRRDYTHTTDEETSDSTEYAYFSSNTTRDNLDIRDFETIIIILNANDFWNTSAGRYDSNNWFDRIGAYKDIKDINYIQDKSNTTYFDDSTDNDKKVKFVDIRPDTKTICYYLLSLTRLIQKYNPTATIRIATPITWERYASTMTESRSNAITALCKEIKDVICQKEGFTYIDTDRINSTNKSTLLESTRSDPVGRTIINKYISQLCANIATNKSEAKTYKVESIKYADKMRITASDKSPHDSVQSLNFDTLTPDKSGTVVFHYTCKPTYSVGTWTEKENDEDVTKMHKIGRRECIARIFKNDTGGASSDVASCIWDFSNGTEKTTAGPFNWTSGDVFTFKLHGNLTLDNNSPIQTGKTTSATFAWTITPEFTVTT